MNNYRIEKFKNKQELANSAAKIISQHLVFCLKQKDRVHISLCGGSTPFKTYLSLSEEKLDWHKVDVFLGDERWVDLNDDSSNSLMLKNSLLSKTPGSKAIFHHVPTTELSSPQRSAQAYEQILKRLFKGEYPVFDLMLLGLGEDGHTASLFPFSPSLKVTNTFTTIGQGKGQERITLTHPILSSARKIIFLVSGSSKQKALQRLLDPLESSDRTPAKLVSSTQEILILADHDSIGKI